MPRNNINTGLGAGEYAQRLACWREREQNGYAELTLNTIELDKVADERYEINIEVNELRAVYEICDAKIGELDDLGSEHMESMTTQHGFDYRVYTTICRMARDPNCSQDEVISLFKTQLLVDVSYQCLLRYAIKVNDETFLDLLQHFETHLQANSRAAEARRNLMRSYQKEDDAESIRILHQRFFPAPNQNPVANAEQEAEAGPFIWQDYISKILPSISCAADLDRIDIAKLREFHDSPFDIFGDTCSNIFDYFDPADAVSIEILDALGRLIPTISDTKLYRK